MPTEWRLSLLSFWSARRVGLLSLSLWFSRVMMGVSSPSPPDPEPPPPDGPVPPPRFAAADSLPARLLRRWIIPPKEASTSAALIFCGRAVELPPPP
ncbi:MAG: hypothetical protein FD126_1465 [Elusimicrobia bacterium]|nr:MAG: hypothetical protein FD126_1465 [Elusimicrobiota bacterium]